jgi:hypothetical protein
MEAITTEGNLSINTRSGRARVWQYAMSEVSSTSIAGPSLGSRTSELLEANASNLPRENTNKQSRVCSENARIEDE